MDESNNTNQQSQTQSQTNEAPKVQGGAPAGASSTDNSTIFGVLAYLGPLVIVSYLLGKDNSFVKFHVKQGAVLFAIQVIIWALMSFMYAFWMIMNLVNLAIVVLAIIGIVNVVQRKEQELSVVGQFSKYFNF